MTDKDLQGKTAVQQREYLTSLKTKMNEELKISDNQFKRQTTVKASMVLRKKQEAVKQSKIQMAQRMEHEKWLQQFYDSKKLQVEAELENEVKTLEANVKRKSASQAATLPTSASETGL